MRNNAVCAGSYGYDRHAALINFKLAYSVPRISVAENVYMKPFICSKSEASPVC